MTMYETTQPNVGWKCYAIPYKRKVFCLLVFASFHLKSTSYAQQISIKNSNITIEQIVREISNQSGFDFFYNTEIFKSLKPTSLDVKSQDIREVLDQVTRKYGLSYRIVGRSVIINDSAQNEKSQPVRQEELITINGFIKDEQGRGLPGVNISSLPSGMRTLSNAHGEFRFRMPAGETIVLTMIGYEPYTEKIGNNQRLNVTLKQQINSLEEVVASGIMNRRAESFTGSSVTIKKDELLRAGNQNILQSLKNIDPSFKMIENMNMGSNPNNLPEIVLRGKSNMPDLTGSFSGNPNQPLFILDGFEATLQRIYDLDMQRVKNVTILKDAVAKAIYGAKAGNGVVIIETLEPQVGKLRVSYTGSLNIESPDLTGYNLMDAKEKLQWEKDHGMWFSGVNDINNIRQGVYNSLYQDVYLKGVDTYWLSKPLQTGVGHRHSMNFEGGDESMRYGATFMYNNITGAMKGSERNTFSGSTSLSYKYKNLLFRNTIEFSQNNSSNSPYGSFSAYTRLNPYWKEFNDNGGLDVYAGGYPEGSQSFTRMLNPLYNASLNIIDRNNYTQVSNNFQMEWRLHPDWRFTGSFGYTHQNTGADNFLPPGHSNFIEYTEANGLINYKGSWTKTDGFFKSLESNIGLNYTKKIGKHLVIGNTTFNISDLGSRSTAVIAEGFGNDNVSDISLASYYQRGGAPAAVESKNRTLGVVGVVNYSFDDRFIFDVNYRTSGSSQYGANSRWGNFWALGGGWNLHNENLIRNLGFNQFRLRGTVGYTGSQNATAASAVGTNQYSMITYDGVKGTTLMALPNPNLAWQKNIDYNIGLDLAFLNNKVSARFEAYEKTTTNSITSMTAPPSIGFSNYITNLGKTVNKGVEVALRYQVFNKADNRSFLNLSIGATHNKNKLVEISDAFASYNNNVDESVTKNNVIYSKPVARYYEGQSLDAIWAMRSLGIDPASGYELFLDRNGNITNNWSSQDLIIAGDAQPKVNGNFGVNAGYKGFNVALTCTFKLGGQLYNSTLVEKVENIDGRSNLDRRILDAWRNVGDKSIYKAPQVNSATNFINYTKPTTRFVQNNDELYFSTINLSYDLQSKKILKSLGLERLRAAFYTNELWRISSITVERGTSYPFARNFSFSLTAGF